jgi:hypothetical protein
MFFAWIKRQASQLSTHIGVALVAFSSIAPQLADIDPRITYAGIIAGALAVVWNQKPQP